jgi:hypothetical protein
MRVFSASPLFVGAAATAAMLPNRAGSFSSPSRSSREAYVLFLLFFLALLAFVMAVVLWGGSLFAQGYFYTEPASGLIWRAPAAAGVLTLFYLFWTVLNYTGGDPATGEVPYPALWRFSPAIFLVNKPVPEFISQKRSTDDEPALYKLDKTQTRSTTYKLANGTENWSAQSAQWIKLKLDGTEYTFERVKRSDDSGYQLFVDKANGWQMDERWIGEPSYTSMPRLIMYFFLNVIHLILWLAVATLLLRFSIAHGLMLGFVMWFAFTLLVLPVLFTNVESSVRRVAQLALQFVA